MLFVAEYEFPWDALSTVVAKRLEWDAAQPDGFRFVGEYVWKDREPPFRGVAVIEVDDVEALNAFALHYGPTLTIAIPPGQRRLSAHGADRLQPRRGGEATARQVASAASRRGATASSRTTRRTDMADAIAIPAWMGDIDPEPDRLSAAGRPQPRTARQTGIAYKDTPDGPLLLDAYRPADDARHPLVVMIHGGGWARGGRFEMGLTKWAGYLASGRPGGRLDRLSAGARRRRTPTRSRTASTPSTGRSSTPTLLGADPRARRPVGRFGRRPPRPAARHLADATRLRRPAPAHRRGATARRRGALSAHRPAGARPRRAARRHRAASSATSSAPSPTTIRSAGATRRRSSRCTPPCRRSSSCRARATCWCPPRRPPASPSASPPPARRTASRSSRAACTASTAIAPDERAIGLIADVREFLKEKLG